MRIAALTLLLAGCLAPERDPGAVDCGACHGDATSPAPPVALGGGTDPSTVAVGAHRAHVEGRTLGVAVACEACHVVPVGVDDEGHVDTPWPAEVRWGELDRTDGALGVWDRDAATCSGGYCHGTTLAGGAATSPVWTVQDGTQVACGACHGDPPPPPHPDDPTCAGCHPALSDGLHLDGTVQLDIPADTCTGCHGDETSIAPPPDTSGSTDPLDPGVGAHAAHEAADVACEACHVVPTAIDDVGHIDLAPAEVVFGGDATLGGAAPTWDGASCSDTYCHGGTLRGGAFQEPLWTLVDGSQVGCGGCHGDPPGGSHVPHASPTIAAAVACGACHVVPDETVAPGHLDAPPVETIFGGLALAGGARPSFTATRTCADSYCHGATLDGGALTEPTWGATDHAALACDACHGMPPANGHPDARVCGDCHNDVGPDDEIVAPAHHVDGIVTFGLPAR